MEVDGGALSDGKGVDRRPDAQLGRPIGTAFVRLDRLAPEQLHEPTGQPMAIHRQPIEDAEEPRRRILDGIARGEGCEQPEVRLLDGIVALLGSEAEPPTERPELRARSRYSAVTTAEGSVREPAVKKTCGTSLNASSIPDRRSMAAKGITAASARAARNLHSTRDPR